MKVVVVFQLCLLLSQVRKSSPLQCVNCLSSKSWDDCNQKAVTANCSDDLNACVKYHKVVFYPRGHQKLLFEKRCWHDEVCSNETCRRPPTNSMKGSWCEMHCCKGSLCNSGVTSLWSKQHIAVGTAGPTTKQWKSVSQSVTRKSSPLQCVKCLSYKSWDDCNQKAVTANCSDYFNTCVKYHKVVFYPSGHQEPLFEKRCWHDEECSNETCRRPPSNSVKGSWCEMQCCKGSLCNAGVTSLWAKQQQLVKQEQQSNSGNAVSYNHGMFTVILLIVISVL